MKQRNILFLHLLLILRSFQCLYLRLKYRYLVILQCKTPFCNRCRSMLVNPLFKQGKKFHGLSLPNKSSAMSDPTKKMTDSLSGQPGHSLAEAPGSDSRIQRQARVIETLVDAAKVAYDDGNMDLWREYGAAAGSLLVLWDKSPNDPHERR